MPGDSSMKCDLESSRLVSTTCRHTKRKLWDQQNTVPGFALQVPQQLARAHLFMDSCQENLQSKPYTHLRLLQLAWILTILNVFWMTGVKCHVMCGRHHLSVRPLSPFVAPSMAALQRIVLRSCGGILGIWKCRQACPNHCLAR